MSITCTQTQTSPPQEKVRHRGNLFRNITHLNISLWQHWAWDNDLHHPKLWLPQLRILFWHSVRGMQLGVDMVNIKLDHPQSWLHGSYFDKWGGGGEGGGVRLRMIKVDINLYESQLWLHQMSDPILKQVQGYTIKDGHGWYWPGPSSIAMCVCDISLWQCDISVCLWDKCRCM